MTTLFTQTITSSATIVAAKANGDHAADRPKPETKPV